MAKRIYSDKNPKLYQLRKDGNFYTLQSGRDLCLETNDFKEAEERLEYQAALNSRFGASAFKFRIGHLFPDFLKFKKREIRPSTYDLYEMIWKAHFEKSLAKVYLGEMTQKRWDKFCEGSSLSDFQNPRNLMHQFLAWCEGKGLILAVPTLKNPKHKRRRRRIVTPAHLKLIFQHAHGSLLLFISMALFMGMRRKEIMALSWPRVDLVNRSLQLRDEDVKTDDGREIPISNVVHALLCQRMEMHQARGGRRIWVFPNAFNSSQPADVSGLKTAWRTCLKKANLLEPGPGGLSNMYTWHDLRATFEKHAHKSTDHTDTQREKMVGADIDVQKRIYVSMTADDLRGLEEVVTSQVPEVVGVISGKTSGRTAGTGKSLENKQEVLIINGVKVQDV